MNDSLRANAATEPEVSCEPALQAAPGQDHIADEPIFLVGMMGAGKTTIGRQLAKALNREFIDLDLALEARCGVPVAVIFEIEGEDGFRRRETQLLDMYSRRQGIVLATGGGAVLAERNRRMLKERGLVVYLRATGDELYQRVARDRQRPLLQTDNPRARVTELLTHRSPLYEEVATVTFDTGSTPISQAVHNLMLLLSTRKRQMNTVNVETPGGHYPIHIGSGRLKHLAQSVPADATSVALVTNPTVAGLYATEVEKTLADAGHRVLRVELPDGEEHKDWQTLNLIFDALLQHRFDRKSVLLALGGGVIGDMVGFAAACYMRGVRFVQVPTTLLAQVDSSVGGKTAVNHPQGKNMIGAFYQPVAVEIDIDVLKTLPQREITAGLAEVIKYGLIIDAEFFAWCEQNVDALRSLDEAAITYAIRRSCELKAYVVSQDERESGLRAILNFGHTFGHAIEAGLGYGQWLHGEAVGCGMVQAAELSASVLGLPRESVERVRALVRAIGCPDMPPDLGTDRWIDLMQVDKKTEGGQLRFVLLPEIGRAVCQSAPTDALREVLQRTVTSSI